MTKKRIRFNISPPRSIRYECFDCGLETSYPFRITKCPYCGEAEDFHVMN